MRDVQLWQMSKFPVRRLSRGLDLKGGGWRPFISGSSRMCLLEIEEMADIVLRIL